MRKPLRLPNLDELIWVEDLRSNQRFIVRRPLSGELMSDRAEVRDLSITGLRIAHRAHVRVGSTARLEIRSSEPAKLIPFETTVVWSRLSDARDQNELLYTSGMRIEDDPEIVGVELGRLVGAYCRPDTTSMETKRLQALEQLMNRTTVERQIMVDLDPAELLASYQALGEVSRLDTEEKAALIQGAKEMLTLTSRSSAWNRDVLAAWKSIDGRVELATVEAARRILLEIDRFVQAQD